MSEQDLLTIFSKRLKYYMSLYDMSQAELAKRLEVGTTSVYNWCNAIKMPRAPKLDKMCEIFHCNRSDLVEDAKSIVPKFEKEHIELINLYSKLEPEQKQSIMSLLRSLAKR